MVYAHLVEREKRDGPICLVKYEIKIIIITIRERKRERERLRFHEW